MHKKTSIKRTTLSAAQRAEMKAPRKLRGRALAKHLAARGALTASQLAALKGR